MRSDAHDMKSPLRNEVARVQSTCSENAKIYPREGFSRYTAENPVYRKIEKEQWRSPTGFTKVFRSLDKNKPRAQSMMS